eukprot:g60094.t1
MCAIRTIPIGISPRVWWDSSMSALKYISRVTHQLSVGVLIGGSILAAFAGVDVSNAGKIFGVSATTALISGLFNAHAAKPKEMGSKAGLYRVLVYGVKIPLWLLLSPLLKKVVADEGARVKIQAGTVVCLVLVSSYAKFYREANTEPKKN